MDESPRDFAEHAVLGLASNDAELIRQIVVMLPDRFDVVVLNRRPRPRRDPGRLAALLLDVRGDATFARPPVLPPVPAIAICDPAGLKQTRPRLLDDHWDFIVWPTTPAELILRVESAVNRGRAAAEPPSIALDGLLVDLRRHQAFRDGRPLRLTRTEFALLRSLVAHRDRVVGRDELISSVWGIDSERGSNLLDVYVRSLRRKLEPNATSPRLIETVRGVGYRWGSSVRPNVPPVPTAG